MRSSGGTALGFWALASLFGPTHLTAQGAEGGPKVLELHTGAATQSLGAAAPLSRPGPKRIFQNPARIQGTGFSAGLTRFGAQSSYGYLAAGTDWAGGAVAVGLQTLSYSTDAATLGGVPAGLDPLLGTGPEDVSELVVTGAYAVEWAGLRWGMGGKLIEQRFEGARSATAGADLGLAGELGPLTLGVAVQNLGRSLELAGENRPLAERVTLGASGHGWVMGPLDLGATGALHREADGSWIPAAGLEVAWWPVVGRTFVGRVGMRRVVDSGVDPVSFGGAFIGDAITIAYAYASFDGLDAAHTFTLSWR